MTRSVVYVTGTRADFGLMLETLKRIDSHPELSLSICPTGMHLSRRFGSTIDEVRASGLRVLEPVAVNIDDDTRLGMALGAGDALNGLARRFAEIRPDLVLLLGDRLEMLSGAIAATCMGAAIAHVHGGERTGTIDESLRHAISKLSHLHLVTTEGAADRLRRMGERPEMVKVVGAPGLVGLRSLVRRSREDLCQQFGLDPAMPLATILFHPVVQDAERGADQMRAVLGAAKQRGLQGVCLLPNADAGNGAMREVMLDYCSSDRSFAAVEHLNRANYVSLLAACDLLIGNSSSGILEAASLSTPVVNVGDRQNARERNSNVIDVECDLSSIAEAIEKALTIDRHAMKNIYEKEDTDVRIASELAKLEISVDLVKKLNAY